VIGFEQSEGIGRLVIQRAPSSNAFTSAMLGRTAEILEAARHDCAIIVISAEGDDFSLGRDRAEPKNPGGPFAAFSEISRVNAAFAAFPGIIVSAIKGRAFGFGLGLAMRSDIALAADDARFMLDEVSLDFPPMFLMEVILDHVAPKRALDLILTSREFGADEALAAGLVSRLVPAGELDTAVTDYIATLGARDPEVLKACKRYLSAIRRMPPDARPAHALVEQTRFAEEHH
jgi:enoyl-CoA hydratase/carnithine racemase